MEARRRLRRPTTTVPRFLDDLCTVCITGGDATQLTSGMAFDAQPGSRPMGLAQALPAVVALRAGPAAHPVAGRTVAVFGMRHDKHTGLVRRLPWQTCGRRDQVSGPHWD